MSKIFNNQTIISLVRANLVPHGRREAALVIAPLAAEEIYFEQSAKLGPVRPHAATVRSAMAGKGLARASHGPYSSSSLKLVRLVVLLILSSIFFFLFSPLFCCFCPVSTSTATRTTTLLEDKQNQIKEYIINTSTTWSTITLTCLLSLCYVLWPLGTLPGVFIPQPPIDPVLVS